MAISNTEMQLRSAQSAILFMQQEHAKTLKGLHEEIQKLQQKCTDLTFQLSIQDSTFIDEDAYKRQIESMETNLKQKQKEHDQMAEELKRKEKKVSLLEQQLKAQEKKFLDELKVKNQKIAIMMSELDARSSTIAYLTMQLHQAKIQQKNLDSIGDRSGKFVPPPPPREGTPTRKCPGIRKALFTPSTSEPVVSGKFNQGSRSFRPTSGQKGKVADSISTPDSSFLMRKLSGSRIEVKTSTTLPPINSTSSQAEGSYKPPGTPRMFVRHPVRTKKKNDISVNTLAVDRVSSSDQKFRQPQQSHTQS